jgi:chorismate dehydratase
MEKKVSKPRIAASIYLNSAPLIWSFSNGALRGKVELMLDKAPARSAQELAQDEADVALVPVIEGQRIPNLVIVSNACVASRGKVRSVVLVTRERELKDVRTVSLDVSSRTSAALVQIMFREFVGREPEYKQSAPDLNSMLDESDAALLIGDPAMTFSRDGLLVYDMATLWREYTGLGFVFALWMARENNVELARKIDFARARDEGLDHVEEIIADYAGSLGLPAQDLHEYLRENISFTLDESLREGLELYYRLAFKHELILEPRRLPIVE